MITEEIANGYLYSSFIVLLASFAITSYIIYEVSYDQQRTVKSLTSEKACGSCLDLAVESNPAADFSFINCPANVKKWTVPGHPDTWSVQEPVADAKMIEDYKSVNKNAFRQIYGSYNYWSFEHSRKPNFDSQGWSLIAVNGLMPLLFAMYILCQQSDSWKLVLSIFNTIFVYVNTGDSLMMVAMMEVQQKRSFGDIDCMMFPSGYAFYSLFFMLTYVFLGYLIILCLTTFLENCCQRLLLIIYVSLPFVLLTMDIFYLIALYKSDSKYFITLLILFLVVFAFAFAFISMLILSLCGVQVAQVFIAPFFNELRGEDEQPLMRGP